MKIDDHGFIQCIDLSTGSENQRRGRTTNPGSIQNGAVNIIQTEAYDGLSWRETLIHAAIIKRSNQVQPLDDFCLVHVIDFSRHLIHNEQVLSGLA
jgi:hypothetical protein